MTLIAGCYERFLFGYNHPTSCSNKESCELQSQFTHAAHKGVVKSLAAAGPFLASGGADDLIHLYDLRHAKDLGFLVNPGEGAITALTFFTPKNSFHPTHLLAGCTDGTLSIWIAGQGWQCMKTLRGHRHEISSIAIHESGALALTTSRDKTLRLWDLVKGRTTFQSKLDIEADQISFSPSGTKYALRAGTRVTIFPVSKGDHIVLEHGKKVSTFLFGNTDEAIITGTEDGVLRAWHASDDAPPSIVVQLDKAHESRIKACAVPKSYTVIAAKGTPLEDTVPVPEATAHGHDFPDFLATASSDGHISMWKLYDALSVAKEHGSPIQDAEEFCLSTVNTKARLTTLCAIDPVDMMDMLALELSTVSKRVKNTAKKHKDIKEKKKSHKKVAHPSTQVQTMKKESRPAGFKTVTHGDDRVVSFIDDTDRERELKRRKQIEIQAKRNVHNGKKKHSPHGSRKKHPDRF